MSHPSRVATHPHHATPATALSKVNGDFVLQAAQGAGIVDLKELSNFMGQMQVESQGFIKLHENLNYSGERLLQVFPGRNGMDTIEKADAIAAGGKEKVAEAIYGGEWGKQPGKLGNTEPGDGWRFHGRGFVQLTGRDNYTHYGKALGLDLVNSSDLVAEPANAAKIATQYWKERVVAFGHQQDITSATKAINGGTNSLSARKVAAADWESKLAYGYKPGMSEAETKLRESPLFRDALTHLKALNIQHNIPSDERTVQAAGAMAVTATASGMTRIDHLEPGGTDNDKLFAVQGQPGTSHSKVVDVPTMQALDTSMAVSAQAFTDATAQALSREQTAQQSRQYHQPAPLLTH